jgi:hypothetical protein
MIHLLESRVLLEPELYYSVAGLRGNTPSGHISMACDGVTLTCLVIYGRHVLDAELSG